MKNARFIINKAKQLLQQFGGVTAPIDVEGICKELGIRFIEKELDDNVSGFLLLKGTQPSIVINTNHETEGRRRFTIAHELGHFVLHKSQTVHILSDDLVSVIKYRNETSTLGVDVEEIEANRFAAELLMPEELIINYINEKNLTMISEAVIEKMAGDFKVSIAALSIRLSKLQLLY
jgi:Zn-dependent peptidase ImmA (M78 family)